MTMVVIASVDKDEAVPDRQFSMVIERPDGTRDSYPQIPISTRRTTKGEEPPALPSYRQIITIGFAADFREEGEHHFRVKVDGEETNVPLYVGLAALPTQTPSDQGR
jgi:hypothetical protein